MIVSPSELQAHNRSAHPASCPCKLCVAYDAEVYYQSREKYRAGWKENGVESWLEMERNRPLNWALEPGCCILCGGIVMDVSAQAEHYLVNRHNPKWNGTQLSVSMLISKSGSWMAVYRRIMFATPAKNITVKPVKEVMTRWACLFLELLPEKCVALASREHEDWIELRLVFNGVTQEEYDRPTERFPFHDATHRGENRASSYQTPQRGGRKVQGEVSVAG